MKTSLLYPNLTKASLKLLLLLSLLLPGSLLAQFTYVTNNGAITITGYGCTGYEVIIPETINGLPVTAIGDVAFSDCGNLLAVTIGNNVTSIGAGSFADCARLASVTIGNNVTTIGDYAFRGCTALTSLTLGDHLSDIGNDAFSGCGLTNLTIPDSVTNVGAVCVPVMHQTDRRYDRQQCG